MKIDQINLYTIPSLSKPNYLIRNDSGTKSSRYFNMVNH